MLNKFGWSIAKSVHCMTLISKFIVMQQTMHDHYPLDVNLEPSVKITINNRETSHYWSMKNVRFVTMNDNYQKRIKCY